MKGFKPQKGVGRGGTASNQQPLPIRQSERQRQLCEHCGQLVSGYTWREHRRHFFRGYDSDNKEQWIRDPKYIPHNHAETAEQAQKRVEDSWQLANAEPAQRVFNDQQRGLVDVQTQLVRAFARDAKEGESIMPFW